MNGNINGIIAEYIAVKAEAATLAKREKALKSALLEAAGSRDFFETDRFAVTVKTSVSFRLDTDALYKDFPDIKETYGKTSVSRSVIPAEEEKRSA